VLTTFQDVLVVLACMLASLVFVWLLNRGWPASQRRDHNDIIGWQVGVLGTTYAVILGFMLYAVWTSYQEADINAETEANCLVSVFRVADGATGCATRSSSSTRARVGQHSDRARVAHDGESRAGPIRARNCRKVVDRCAGNQGRNRCRTDQHEFGARGN
jgi:hypothetical protein